MPWRTAQAHSRAAVGKLWREDACHLSSAVCHDSPGGQSVRCEDTLSHRRGGYDAEDVASTAKPHVCRHSTGMRLAQDPRYGAGATEKSPCLAYISPSRLERAHWGIHDDRAHCTGA